MKARWFSLRDEHQQRHAVALRRGGGEADLGQRAVDEGAKCDEASAEHGTRAAGGAHAARRSNAPPGGAPFASDRRGAFDVSKRPMARPSSERRALV
jgi:hypothetical protein